MIRTVWIAAALALSCVAATGCSSQANQDFYIGPYEPVAPASDAEKATLMKAYISCLVGEAARLDDHQSDAATIASAISGACATEFSYVKEVSERGLSPDAQAMFGDQLRQLRLQGATEAVLIERQRPAAK